MKTSAGFTMIEAVLSVVIVGLMLLAAMTALGAVGTSRLSLVEQQRGLALAESMLAEIVNLPYVDPDALPGGSLGPSAAEVAPGNRTLFDDVDDYHGWTASPLQWNDGATIDNTIGWTREVTVAWVDPNNPDTASVIETGAKRISVTVKRGDKIAATLAVIRTERR